MRRENEAAMELEKKLRKADEELRLEQKRNEEQKALLAEAAASQKKQTEEEVCVPSHPPFRFSLVSPFHLSRILYR